MLADMVEMVKKSEMRCDSPTLSEPGDVKCSVCTGRKRKAVKSCVDCLSSYCGTHFKAHNDLFPGKKHKMVKADGKLHDLICSQHDKLLEVFCRTDQKCICLLCVMDEHSGHKTVSIAAERAEKQKELGQNQVKCQQTIQEKQKHLQEVKEVVRVMKQSTRAAVKNTEAIFAEMIRSIKRRCSEVTKLIRDQERADVTQAEDLMKTLEWEIAELKRRDAELDRLSKTQDHTSFLQSFHLCSFTDQGLSPSDISVCSHVSFEKVTQSVSKMRDELEGFLKQGACSMAQNVKQNTMFPPPEPLTREDFLQYSCELHLDPVTAQRRLHLIHGNKEAICKDELSPSPNNPERFDHLPQVLCKENVSGRCYWEVEWGGQNTMFSQGVCIAVSSKKITRKGSNKEAWFGHNRHSWSLSCTRSSCFFMHNGESTRLDAIPSNRIGVYVDRKVGILSFYNLYGGTMTLLHKIQIMFTQPLFPGFWLGGGAKVSLCK